MTTAIEYASEADAASVATELAAARQAGFKRPELAQVTGLTSAKVWRAEQGRVHATEFKALRDALDKIASGELKPAQRGRVDARQVKIDVALAAIDAVNAGATKATLWQALADVAAALRADDEPAAE